MFFTRAIATTLSILLLSVSVTFGQRLSPRISDPETSPDVQQDTPDDPYQNPYLDNIQASRPEALTLWEYMSQYTGSDKVQRLLNGYATGQVLVKGGGWCSGVMISPHIFMTAAHCGGPEWTGSVRFFHVDEDAASPGSSAQSYSEEYRATTFPWQSFNNHDINLWWVENGSDGVAPGIRYGYLELSPLATARGDGAYSFWVNPVTQLMNGSSSGDTLLHSAGSVGSPTQPNFSDYPDLYVNSGASGSAIVGTGRHANRVIGVTATGPITSTVANSEGFGRRAADTRHLLDLFDADGNDVLDAIEYDMLYTRTPEKFYRLGFDSPLQRALWRKAGADAPPGNKSGLTNELEFWTNKIVGSGERQFNDGMWHSTVRFASGGTYRFSIVVYGKVADSAEAYIRLRSDSTNSSIFMDFKPVVGAWTRYTFRVKVGTAGDYRLVLGDRFKGEYYVSDLAVVDESALVDFESGYERGSWEVRGDSYITANGFSGGKDFSGISGPVSGGGWSLRNRHLGLRANRTYEITFDARHISGPLSTQFVRVENLSGVVAGDRPFSITSPGGTFSGSIRVKTGNESGNTLTFGSYNGTRFMVDNIRITEL